MTCGACDLFRGSCPECKARAGRPERVDEWERGGYAEDRDSDYADEGGESR